jgi:hypothetical protein
MLEMCGNSTVLIRNDCLSKVAELLFLETILQLGLTLYESIKSELLSTEPISAFLPH